ncbi:transcriptional regulator [Stenotrophomonas indicatrix]|uniref:transcriptional regulator n=1 Tax=Stenotrophomonas indicatrix TaxID=2045451 RepID=UPI000B86A01F|nr:YdaS family helix-turn-helix protein [Stenotrophomonas indicatrix]
MKNISLKALGGPAHIGRVCGVSSQAVSQWKRVPAEYVLAIEEATGVSRHDLRPDVFGPAPKKRGTTRKVA